MRTNYNKHKADVVVLIPHFNNDEKLLESILSIKESIQIDLLIVDDGSQNQPNISKIQNQYANGLVWMEVLEKNKGIEHALNKGLEIIEKLNYKYIARLDCGDLNIKNKYTKQFNYLEKNLDVNLLGTWADMVNENGTFLYTLKHPVGYDEIKNKMYINSMFIHPTVMFRFQVLKDIGKYPVNYKAAEDYAYFFKIIKKMKAQNYPESLLIYEVNSNSISSTKRKEQVKNRIKIIWSNFYFGTYPIYGLLRNSIIYFMPNFLIQFLKSVKK